MRLSRDLMPGSTLLLACGIVGCLPSEYDIEVSLKYPQDSVASGVEVTVFPFDRDALRDSLASVSDVPRPQFQDLESELQSFRPPDLSGLGESLAPWQAIYDSVKNLADSLNARQPDNSAQYTRAYDRLRDQYQRLAQATVERDAAISELVGDDKDLAMRAAAAADSLRAWEGIALASYPEIADSAIARSGLSIHSGTTDENGIVEFTLPPGRWWIVASCLDPDNPFIEYYWNVDIRVRLIGSRSVILNEESGVGKWRY